MDRGDSDTAPPGTGKGSGEAGPAARYFRPPRPACIAPPSGRPGDCRQARVAPGAWAVSQRGKVSLLPESKRPKGNPWPVMLTATQGLEADFGFSVFRGFCRQASSCQSG